MWTESLLSYVKDVLLRCNFQHGKLAAMAFDDASVMKCLSKLIKEEIHQDALYFHCMAHVNELVFRDATAHSELISDAHDFCEDIYALIGVSPKIILLLQKMSLSREYEDEDSSVGMQT